LWTHNPHDPTFGIRALLAKFSYLIVLFSMASTSSNHIEGLCTTRPPLLNGSNYDYWKNRMKIFLISNDLKYWMFLQNPYTPPKEDELDSLTRPKMKEIEMNSKIMNILYCGLNEGEYNRIRGCVSAYEIWHRLQMHHEGDSKTKEARISLLMHKYEIFSMQIGENISEMNTRFTDITNSLLVLGRRLNEGEMTRKFLRSLSHDWEDKVVAIEEAHDLSQLKMEELIGNLMAYELQINHRKEK